MITEVEKNRISMLNEREMLKESRSWTPDQWAAYLTKGNVFDDGELDDYIENVIIKEISMGK